MKRFVLFLTLLAMLVGAVAMPAAAQDAPEGVWLGTWPYVAPGTHHLSSFSTGGLNDNLGVLYRPLVELQPAYYVWADNAYQGILAESWGFVDDNTAYEYTIKEGAMWSNGDPVTATDVVNTFAIGRILGWTQFTYVDTVEAVSDRTVRFNFKEGQASLLAERLILKEYVTASANYADLAAQATQLVTDGVVSGDQAWTDLATAIAEFRPETLIASGPYTYTLDDVGEAFMTLHWQPNSLYSDSVQFGELKLWAGETEVTAPLVLSGELAHSTNVYSPTQLDAFAAEGVRLVSMPRGYGPALLFNYQIEAFNNRALRQAMAYAIDRTQSAVLTNGLGAFPTEYMSGMLDSLTPVLLSEEGVAALNRYEYNLETAEALMGEAGYTRNDAGLWADADGNTLDFEYVFPADFLDFAGMARDAVAQLNQFGFNITERGIPWQEAAEAIRQGDYDLSVWSWGAGSPFAFNNLTTPTRRWNNPVLPPEQVGMSLNLMEYDYNGEIIDLNALILDVSVGLDTDALKAKADYVSKILNEEMLFIPLNEELSVEVINEASIAGVPADGDPIFSNPSNENYVIWLLLNGTLHPAG